MSPSDVLPLKTSVQSVQDVKLAEYLRLHLGMTGDQPFDTLSMENKEKVGNRLEGILLIVANGSLVSLMISIIHKMYTSQDIQHSTSLDNMTAKLLGEAEPDITTAEKPEVSVVRKGPECPDCGKIFKSQHSLLGHLKEQHFHSCPVCGKKFGLKSNLKAHQKSVHDGQKFPCQICDRLFTTKGSMNLHILTIHNSDIDVTENKIRKKHHKTAHFKSGKPVTESITSRSQKFRLSTQGHMNTAPEG